MSKENKIKLVVGMFVTCELFEGKGEIMETVQNPNGSFQHRVRVDMQDGWVPAEKLTFVSNPIADQIAAKKEQDAIRDLGINERIAHLEAENKALKEDNERLVAELEKVLVSAEDRITELEAELEKAPAPVIPPAPAPGK